MRWKMSVCACLAAFLLHGLSFGFGFCISKAAESPVVTWIWTVTCCGLVHLCPGRLAGLDHTTHFDSDCP